MCIRDSAHTALFGVYGFLSLGFVFLIARYIRPEVEFNDKLMKFGFWALNWGLALMVLISLLPIGLIQSWASVTQGLWLARSEDFMQQPLLSLIHISIRSFNSGNVLSFIAK